MKKILWLGIIFSFLFAGRSFAAYTLTITPPSANVIYATLTGAQGSTSKFQLLVQTTPFAAGAYIPTSTSGTISAADPTIQTPDATGTMIWSLTESYSTTYYVRVLELPAAGFLPSYATDPSTITTGSQPTSIPSTNTFTPTGGGASSNLNPSSYTFISKGLPGLSVLPDPATCAAETAAAQAAGKAAPVCDVNGLLNYFMKLLIGISGVFLVFRLMYEGYVIMTTDIPFLKASSKNGFMTALMGLLLALTSYIILNTINPKLVQESVGVVPLGIGIAGDDGLGVPNTSVTPGSGGTTNKSGGPLTLSLQGGGTASIIPCDPNNNEMQTITVFGGKSVTIQKNLVASVQKISNEWQQMSPRYPIVSIEGFNCRTIASITKLSYHAYGLAIDINPDTNPPGGAGDIPQSFKNLWTAEGWGWGGNWKSSTDTMHFSKGTNEGGNMTGQ